MSGLRVRVVVTRPKAQAAEWVQRLLLLRIDAVVLPLIDIAALDDPSALDAAWPELARHRLVVFVSSNAVEQFFARRPVGLVWPADLLAASPGPGTTRALQRAGLIAAQIVEPAPDAQQFDSEALWQRLAERDWHDASVLILRGGQGTGERDGSGRDWLADRLRAHGAQVELLAAYRRRAPAFGSAEVGVLRAALADPSGHLWNLSSSEAIDNLAAWAGAATGDWAPHTVAEAWLASIATATHPRIAARARAFGFGRVLEVRPSMDAVIACIQSIAP